MLFKPLIHMPQILWSLWLILLGPAAMIILSNSSTLISWEITIISSLPFHFDVILDQKSMIMSLTVLFISANIFMFSTKYMESDPFKDRFTLILLSFVISMLLLTLSPNLATLLLGWDGLGISSFVLVMFYQNPKSLGAAMLTVLTNRLGDTFLIISIMICISQNHFNTLFFHSIDQTILSWLIILASTTKSAQIPFVSWLPAAMAAPTPVSALVHSSTLVTAGIYLLIRISPCLNLNPSASSYLLIMSSLTILMASLAACMENDLKKIIALSTLSQLGVMMMTLAFKIPTFTFFHLITHALFKALMFLCAGTIIMLNNHTQDLRASTNLAHQMPLISAALITSALALSGFPFLAGFYSKDLIIELMITNPINWIPLIVLISATALTSTYSARLVITTLSGGSPQFPLNALSMMNSNLMIPCSSLMLGAISTGSIMNWMMIQPFPHPSLSLTEKLTPVTIMLLGLFLIISLPKDPSSPKTIIHAPITSMWFMTPMSTQLIIKHPLKLSTSTTLVMEKGWTEMLGPLLAKQIIYSLTSYLKKSEQLLISKQVLFGLISLILLILLIN